MKCPTSEMNGIGVGAVLLNEQRQRHRANALTRADCHRNGKCFGRDESLGSAPALCPIDSIGDSSLPIT